MTPPHQEHATAEHVVRKWDDEDTLRARKMMDEWERSQWVMRLLYRAVVWIGGVITFVVISQDFLARVWRGIKATFHAQ